MSNVLIVGGGGREDALLDVILRSSLVSSVYVCPGNAGMCSRAECVSLEVDDVEGIKRFVLEKKISYVIIGPEYPLTLGLSDELRSFGVRCFGVSQSASLLEGSKSFAKSILTKYGIPTASYEEFTDIESALSYLSSVSFPVVVKFDGLAAGKGVYICEDYDSAKGAAEDIFIANKFSGGSSNKVVIEDYLVGKEISAFAFTDGRTVVPLIYAQDYKKVYEGDEGPNTGGMGSYTPVSFMTASLKDKVYNLVLKASVDALRSEGIDYRGILYAGLMIGEDEDISVLEYNVRFGDPEAQVILPLLRTDFIEIVSAIESGELHNLDIVWDNDLACVCVVLASSGYPGSYETGNIIEGIKDASLVEGVRVFHAGTKLVDGKYHTNGGRVLNVVARAETLSLAHDRAYEAVNRISFSNKYFRSDIASRDINK